MKKSCYAIKQTKIEPHILSPYLSNKDSLAEDRGYLQVFISWKKQKPYLAGTRMQSAKEWHFKFWEQFTSEDFFFPWKVIGHRYWCLFKHVHFLCLFLSETNMSQKQMKKYEVSISQEFFSLSYLLVRLEKRHTALVFGPISFQNRSFLTKFSYFTMYIILSFLSVERNFAFTSTRFTLQSRGCLWRWRPGFWPDTFFSLFFF